MKPFTVIKTRRGQQTSTTATLEEHLKYFAYTLEVGNSWNPKINRNPKTAKGLISALNKSVTETQGSCYDPNYYELGK